MTALGRAGYYSHAVGKCHFTPYNVNHENHGFDSRERQEELTSRPEYDEYLQFLWENGGRHITDPHGVRGEMYYVPQPAQMSAALHPTQWVGDRASDFIRQRRTKDQPWHLFASFIHPHPPFCPPAPWHKLYRDMDLPLPHLPPSARDNLLHINRLQNRYKRRDQGYDMHLVRMQRAYYYAAISFIDYQVGRLLAALEETGQLDKTLILFTSDHGELLGDFFSFGKRSYHDAASRITLLARHPALFPAGHRCTTPVSLLDVTTTMLAAAGARFDTHAPDGTDLAALAGAPDADRTVFSMLNRAESGIYMAINRRWKYVYSAPDQRELLFNRESDPGETVDLGDVTWDPVHEPVRALRERRAALHAVLRAAGETDALDGDDWRQYPRRTMPVNPNAGMLYQDQPWADQTIPGYTR